MDIFLKKEEYPILEILDIEKRKYYEFQAAMGLSNEEIEKQIEEDKKFFEKIREEFGLEKE